MLEVERISVKGQKFPFQPQLPGIAAFPTFIHQPEPCPSQQCQGWHLPSFSSCWCVQGWAGAQGVSLSHSGPPDVPLAISAVTPAPALTEGTDRAATTIM